MTDKQDSISTTLTSSNYYDSETDWKWLSKTIYWQFLQCESAALAMMRGDYSPFKDDSPLLFGNYIHSFLESEKAHREFIQENEKKLFKRGKPENGLLKKYEQAETCIEALRADPTFFSKLYRGDKEVVVTGKIDGVLWKGKIDCLDLNRKLFVDFKTVDDIHKKHWMEGQYTNFAIQRGYDVQMAIYQELIEQTFGVKCQPIIAAMSKQEVPDKQTIMIEQGILDMALDEVKAHQQRVSDVIHGQVKPKPCNHCDYCRSQKTFNDIVEINDIKLY